MSKDDDDPGEKGDRSKPPISPGPYKWLTDFHKDLLAGALLGGVMHTTVAPIERAKVLLQTQESNLAIVGSGRRKFKGMVDCIGRTVKEEGILSLWRGNGSSVIRHYPSVALNFSLKDLYKNIFHNEKHPNGPFLSSTLANFTAGAAAGCTTLILIYPLDIAHTRLAADIGRTDVRQFRGIFHFLTTIHNKDGIRGVYRGLPASLQGMVVHRSLYFGGFDTMKEIFSKADDDAICWCKWSPVLVVYKMFRLIVYTIRKVRTSTLMENGSQLPYLRIKLSCVRVSINVHGGGKFYKSFWGKIRRSHVVPSVIRLHSPVSYFLDFFWYCCCCYYIVVETLK
ncbi:hypothetical protein SADUNF_Sadunf06G0180500 [Salix dunnii]|uniref:ADP/ATP translocase n=1 Tax=Salix dunnii TaxID=1413687 RepID=A0A835K2V0_9ROSI|nr:hypothetical protein SADUNF_Sadunf06G0180500 [Salix dunnii]